MSWNGYPKYIRKSILHNINSSLNRTKTTIIEDKDLKKIWITLPYIGVKGESLIKSTVKKLRTNFKENVTIITRFNDTKMSMFCSNKDKLKFEQISNLIYEFTCPGCQKKYIGKTDRCLSIRLNEHATRDDQPIHQHLTSCMDFNYIVQLFKMPEIDDNCNVVDQNQHLADAVMSNVAIVDTNHNWSQLEFLEAYYIKTHDPAINVGLKASKELQLFK